MSPPLYPDLPVGENRSRVERLDREVEKYKRPLKTIVDVESEREKDGSERARNCSRLCAGTNLDQEIKELRAMQQLSGH